MSHEIRSPINSIVGFAELLKDVKNDKEKINQYIDIIQKSSESLTKIVNDIECIQVDDKTFENESKYKIVTKNSSESLAYVISLYTTKF